MADQHFKIISGGGLEWLQCAALARIPWLIHAFSTRKGGFSRSPADPRGPKALNLGAVNWDRRVTVQINRQMLLRQIGAADFSLAMLRQIHSAEVFRAARGRAGQIEYRPAGLPGSLEFEAIPITAKTSAHSSQTEQAPDETGRQAVTPHVSQGPARRPVSTGMNPPGDALLTDEPGILLSIRTADCLPILLVDPKRRTIAAVHAGWRGALAHIAEKAVGDMRREFCSRPDDLIAVIGPSIRRCCYEVRQDVVDAFEGRFAPSGLRQDLDEFFSEAPSSPGSSASEVPVSGFLASGPPGHGPQKTKPVHLDLVAVARYQLARAGVPPAQVHVADFCTACRTDLFFSHRKEGSLAGRMMAVIGIRE